MPRFGFGSSPPEFSSPLAPVNSPPPYTTPSYGNNGPPMTMQSPPMGSMALMSRPGGDSNINNKSSVNLCCSSGDGKAVFSLGFRGNAGFYVERRTLPLHDEDDPTAQFSGGQQQQAILPDHVQDMLQLSGPVELIYVESDSSSPQTKATRAPSTNVIPPSLLCIYTRKNAYYLELIVDAQGEAQVNVEEAFDSVLALHDDLTILRIRPAPQRRMDFATLCPRGAMAMLVRNPYNQYQVVLQHSHKDGLVSIPVEFSLEDLNDPAGDIVDFCFAQSDGLSLFSSMTVLLLKGSGDVLAASPVVFDASVAQKSFVNECVDFLDYQIQTLVPSHPKSPQCKAARAWLMDTFGGQDPASNFATARVILQAKAQSASWPVQLQGPVLRMDDTPGDGTGYAVVIENFSSSELVGVAIGLEGHKVNLGIISPSCLVPRFTFGNVQEGHLIDEALSRAGAVVQRLSLSDEAPSGAPLTNQSLALVRDPLVDSMLHYVTNKGITTVTTTAMRHALRKAQAQIGAQGGGGGAAVRSSAWTSVSTTSGSIEGAIIGSDPKFGHALIARLSDGSLVPVNITESQYLHEMEHLVRPNANKNDSRVPETMNPSAAALKKIEELQPLYEIVDPLLKKVTDGLSGMGKIVGSSTASKDISPEKLAVALAVKARCEKEVVLPLNELRRTVQARREILKSVFKDQKEQARTLKKTIATMQARMAAMSEKMETAQENAKNLGLRSASVLQASQDLLPSLTQAEYDYIQQLKKLRSNLAQHEASFEVLNRSISVLRTSLDDKKMTCKIQLDESTRKNAETMIKGCVLSQHVFCVFCFFSNAYLFMCLAIDPRNTLTSPYSIVFAL